MRIQMIVQHYEYLHTAVTIDNQDHGRMNDYFFSKQIRKEQD